MNYDYGLMCVVANAIVYIITFLFSLRYTNGLVSFILFLYALSSSLGIALFCYQTEEWNITLIPYIYFYVILMIMLYPLTKFNPSNVDVRDNDIPNIILYIGIFLVCFSLVRSLAVFSEASYLGQGYEMSEVYKVTRAEAVSNAGSGLNINIASMLTVLANPITGLAVFFVYYFLTLKKSLRNILIAELFIVFIAATILKSLLGADRSQSVRYILWFALVYFIFKGSIKIPKFVKTQIFIGLGIVCVLFGVITISRFDTRGRKTEDPVVYAIVNYGSQGLFHFNAHFFKNEIYSTHGDYTAAFIRFLLRQKYSRSFNDADINHDLSDPNVSGHVFNTYLGAFVLDYGKWITAILMLLISISFRFFVNWNNLRLDSLLLIYLYVQMLGFGIIAYQYAYFFASLYLAVWLSGIIVFRLHSNFQERARLRKYNQ